MISGDPEFSIVREDGSGSALLESLSSLDVPTDVVVVDKGLSRGRGFDTVRASREVAPQVGALAVSPRETDALSALRSGALGFVTTDAAPELWRRALRAVARGTVVLYGGLSAPDDALVRGLSERERQVFTLVGWGRTTKEIAGLLGIGVKTVETHRLRLRDKLGVRELDALKRLAGDWVRGMGPA